ncbi:MAG TPA: hypothetical protein VME18_06610 [Acidobacteriaceae bacterium]|nr:hypothetical protein [Acidobacteriaceae bacterium]
MRTPNVPGEMERLRLLSQQSATEADQHRRQKVNGKALGKLRPLQC